MKHSFQIVHFDQLTSSNDHAKQFIHQYRDKTILWCDQQLQGRGRFTRVWQSGKDLTFSILFKSDGVHQMLAPLAVVKALATLHCDCQIKWPNDILYQGKKLCGILVEKVFMGEKNTATIVGIGVNLTPVSKDLKVKAIHLPFAPKELLLRILEQYEQLLTQDPETIWKQYRCYNALQGRKILQNDVLWDVLDISPEGWLIVSHEDEICMWKSEEITLEHIY